MGEQRLPGGFVTAVVRAGETVRRQPSADAQFVHALLGWFERRGWTGAPRFLGTDERGREVLGFIDGHVAWEPVQPPSVTSERSLAGVAALVREFHDLTAGTPLAAGAEVVCHNDLSPKNILWWQDRCWRGIDAKAAVGDPAMIRLRDAGAAQSVRDAFDWVSGHRAELAAQVSSPTGPSVIPAHP
jgi:hypothetical protein